MDANEKIDAYGSIAIYIVENRWFYSVPHPENPLETKFGQFFFQKWNPTQLDCLKNNRLNTFYW